MTKKITTWREFVKHARRIGGNEQFQKRVTLAPVHYRINEREKIKTSLTGIEFVGLETSGRDCDGGSYRHFHAVNPSGAFAAQHLLEEAYSWMDGPGHARFVDAEALTQ